MLVITYCTALPPLKMGVNSIQKLHFDFFYRRNSFLSFGGPQLYNSEPLPFTYDQYVIIELADKLCYCLFLCESMNFHPDKQLFQVASAGDRTTDPWIAKPALYLYTMGNPPVIVITNRNLFWEIIYLS